jgi:HAMP domain-containing protein
MTALVFYFNLSLVDVNLHNALGIILICSGIIICLVTISIVLIANKISEPVEELKTAALSLAAGEYGEKIHVEGPKEIVELANTLNTLSECLQENISRLKESSLARERMYGEYECSLLLQHHMLQMVIDEYSNDRLSLKILKVASSRIPQGIFLKLNDEADGTTRIDWIEARQPGFTGIYDLLVHNEKFEQFDFPYITAFIDFKGTFAFKNERMDPPLIWDSRLAAFRDGPKNVGIHEGDLIFFFNRYFAQQFQHERQIQDWFGKVLRHFGSESLDAITNILYNELNFLNNKDHVDQDMYILCLKIVNPKSVSEHNSVQDILLPRRG